MLLRTLILAARRPLSIIVTPEDGAETHQFHLSRARARLVLVGIAVAAVLVGLSVVQWAVGVGLVVDARRAIAENDSLRAEFDKLSGIQQSLSEVEEMQDRLRALAGIDRRSMAVADTGDAPGGGVEAPAAWAATLPTGRPRKGPLSRGFDSKRHSGVDIAGPVGAPVTAAGGGVVTSARGDSVFGNVVVIDHGHGYESWYGHNDRLLVSKGDSVRIGQEVAKLGNTGRSSAPHLHFEVRKDGVPVDPGQYIREYR